jgi:hypothetical protein
MFVGDEFAVHHRMVLPPCSVARFKTVQRAARRHACHCSGEDRRNAPGFSRQHPSQSVLFLSL